MKVSVITINRNNAAGLAKTMKSVFAQTFSDFEYIVVDGASTDDSLRIIHDYENTVKEGRAIINASAFIYVSEPDTGIYNAMNKGVKMAKGEYTVFLNSGDSFCAPDTVEQVLSCVKEDPAIIIGRVNVEDHGDIVVRDLALRHTDITLFSLYLYGIPHQATFIKRRLFDKYPYDESVKINADWKFFLQTIIMDGVSVCEVPVTIANYDNSGYSSVNMDILLAERRNVFEEVIPKRIRSDYEAVFEHYYEAYRMQWLLKHRIFYKIYRMLTSFGMRIL